MQDILKTRIEAHQDTAYYAALMVECQAQIDAAAAQEKRMETVAKTVTEQQQQLEQQLIEAWDNPDTFAALSTQHSQLATLYTLAPKALLYWQKRTLELRHKLITLKSQRDTAQVAARYEAEAAAQEAAKQEAIAEERAEREQKQREREAERQQQQEAIAAMNATVQQQQDTITQETMGFMERLKQSIIITNTPIRKDK